MNSRWTTEPIRRNGQIVATRPNVEGDITILKILAIYILLTALDICALTGRSYKAVIARLNKLKRKPNELITVSPAQLNERGLYQFSQQAYQLTPRGVARLAEMGFEAKLPRPS